MTDASVTDQHTADLPPTAALRNPNRKTVRAVGSWQGSMTTEVRVRNFAFRSDEPAAVGGTDSAPTPMEFVAGAVNSCITVVVETVAAELGVAIRQIETQSTAQMDVRGFRGTADVSPHFQNYALRVQVVTTATQPQLTELTRQVEARCPALNLIRDAGVPVNLQWEFSAEPVRTELVRTDPVSTGPVRTETVSTEERTQ